MKLLKQSLVVVLAIITVFIIAHTPLTDYIAQILGVLIVLAVIYIVIQKRRKRDKELFVGSHLEFFAIAVAILLTIFLTDGLYSNLFFLVYFLLFGISFMFEPLTVFVFLLGLLILFVQQALQNDIFSNMIRLGSLALLSPIAFFFGREFRRREKLEDEIQKKTDQILEDAKELKSVENTNTSDAEKETVENIEKEALDLKKEAEE